MANTLIEKSSHAASGFYLHNLEALSETLLQLEAQRQPTILMGVSYALLDLIALQPFQLRHTLVMETGGMKGRRPEMIKEALHEQLKKGLGVSEIHSEYGMTELLSQAYSKGDGLFQCPLDAGLHARSRRCVYQSGGKDWWYQCHRLGQPVQLFVYCDPGFGKGRCAWKFQNFR